MHHTQSCVLAPDSNTQEHDLDTYFLLHDIQTTAVPFTSVPDLLPSPLNRLPPRVPCQAFGSVCYQKHMWRAKGFLLALRQTCIKLQEANTAQRPGKTCHGHVHSTHTYTETHTHTAKGRGIKTTQLKQQCLFPGKMSGSRYRQYVSTQRDVQRILCIKNYSHNDRFLSGLKSSMGINALNTSV